MKVYELTFKESKYDEEGENLGLFITVELARKKAKEAAAEINLNCKYAFYRHEHFENDYGWAEMIFVDYDSHDEISYTIKEREVIEG